MVPFLECSCGHPLSIASKSCPLTLLQTVPGPIQCPPPPTNFPEGWQNYRHRMYWYRLYCRRNLGCCRLKASKASCLSPLARITDCPVELLPEDIRHPLEQCLGSASVLCGSGSYLKTKCRSGSGFMP